MNSILHERAGDLDVAPLDVATRRKQLQGVIGNQIVVNIVMVTRDAILLSADVFREEEVVHLVSDGFGGGRSSGAGKDTLGKGQGPWRVSHAHEQGNRRRDIVRIGVHSVCRARFSPMSPPRIIPLRRSSLHVGGELGLDPVRRFLDEAITKGLSVEMLQTIPCLIR